MTKVFSTTKKEVEKMTWDEVKDLMGFMIRNKLYDEFCEYLGNQPHVVRHNVELRKMNE